MKAQNQQQAQERWNAKKAGFFSPFGRFLYAMRAVDIYGNGDHFDMMLRWWHPLTWLLWLLIALAAPFISMFTAFTVISIFEGFGCRPSEYYRSHPEQLFFVK